MQKNIFAFCVITFEPIEVQTRSANQNDHLNLSCVKDIYGNDGKVARNGQLFSEGPLISYHGLRTPTDPMKFLFFIEMHLGYFQQSRIKAIPHKDGGCNYFMSFKILILILINYYLLGFLQAQ